MPLVEAMAIGHDCGHGPGGHASEDALSPYLDGGFDHAPWGADVTLQPLNLCAETLDGIRNHSWSLPAPQTPEGEVVSWADRIAYVCHDFEDAVAAGIVTADMLPPIVAERCGRDRSRQLGTFVRAMVDGDHGDRPDRHGHPTSPRRSPSSAGSTTSTSTCARRASSRPAPSSRSCARSSSTTPTGPMRSPHQTVAAALGEQRADHTSTPGAPRHCGPRSPTWRE